MWQVWEHRADYADRLVGTYDNEHDAQVSADYYNRTSNYTYYFISEEGKKDVYQGWF